MVLATVASDLHQLGNALAADIVGWGSAIIGIALEASAVIWILRLIRPEPSGAGPAVIGEAVAACVGEDKMIE